MPAYITDLPKAYLNYVGLVGSGFEVDLPTYERSDHKYLYRINFESMYVVRLALLQTPRVGTNQFTILYIKYVYEFRPGHVPKHRLSS
jgi:hypothetical protein